MPRLHQIRHSCDHDGRCCFAGCAQSLPRMYRPTAQCLHVLILRSCSSDRRGRTRYKESGEGNLDANHLTVKQVGGQEALPEVDNELSSLAIPPADPHGFRAATRPSMLAVRLRLLGWAVRAKGAATLLSDTGCAAACKAVGLVSRLLAAAFARSLKDRAQHSFSSLQRVWVCIRVPCSSSVNQRNEPEKHGTRRQCG